MELIPTLRGRIQLRFDVDGLLEQLKRAGLTTDEKVKLWDQIKVRFGYPSVIVSFVDLYIFSGAIVGENARRRIFLLAADCRAEESDLHSCRSDLRESAGREKGGRRLVG